MWPRGRAVIRPLAACASRRSAAEAVYAPAMAQQLPFLLRGFACPNSDADPKDKAERAPDFHEIAHKKESDIGEGKHLTDTLHFSVPTAPPGTDHPEPAGAPPETVKVEPAPGVKTAGAGDGAANVTPEVPPGGISVTPPNAGGGRAFHTLRRSFFSAPARWAADGEAPPRPVAHPGEGGEASLSPAGLPAHGHEAHKAAGEADAAGMHTGGAMNPPPGMAFDMEGGHAPAGGQGAAGTPTGDAGAAADTPGDIIGVAPKIPEPGPEAGFGPEMHKAGQAEAAGMATGGGGISPPKRGFATRAGAYPNPPQALSGARAAAGLPARSFAGPMGLSFIPSPASGWGFARRMSTPGGPDDSMHNPPDAGWTPADRGETGGRPSVGVDDVKEFAGNQGAGKGAAAPIDAGVPTPHQTGVTAIGGTPMQTADVRRNQPDLLHRETDSMDPELDERIAEGVVKGNEAVGGKDIADHEWGRSGP